MKPSLLIDNRDVAAADCAVFARFNPVTGSVASEAASASAGDARKAVDSAETAFAAWAETGPTARRTVLEKAANVMEARAEDFVAAGMSETGGTRAWALYNVRMGAMTLREAAAQSTQITGDILQSDRPGTISMSVRQPAGVVLGMAPWNSPVILGVRAIATPIACGNTTVLKSSEFCPMTHWLIGDVLRQAGLPPGVCNVVSTAPEAAPAAVEALIRHPAVRRVNFTGSTRTGKIIARLCAEELKPALLELGGKAPLLVLEDADLNQAVAAAAFGAFMNSGQICMSTERIVVVDSVADAFVTKLAEKVRIIRAGDPNLGKTILGSVADLRALPRLESLIIDAVSKGAVLHQAAAPEGALVSAAILDGVTPEMSIYEEESFGPLTAIVRVPDEAAAIKAANDTAYGLTAAVFTRDVARGLKVAKRLDTGMCHINGPTVFAEAHAPFGGVKASGYGRFGGKAGIDAFTELRWITLSTEPVQYPF